MTTRASVEHDRAQEKLRAERLLDPTPENSRTAGLEAALNLPDDDRRVRFLDGAGSPGSNTPGWRIVDGYPSNMQPEFIKHMSRVAKRAEMEDAEEAACARCTEEEARALLAEVEPSWSQALECCHFGCMPRRELARRVGVSHVTMALRVSRARERIERWTGKPISNPVNRRDPNVQALARSTIKTLSHTRY